MSFDRYRDVAMLEPEDLPRKFRRNDTDRSSRSPRPLPPLMQAGTQARTRSGRSSGRDRPNFWQSLFGRGKAAQRTDRGQVETTLQPLSRPSERYPDGLNLFQPQRLRSSSAPTQLPPTQLGPRRSTRGLPPPNGSTLPFKRRPDSTRPRPADRTPTRLERSPQAQTVLQSNTVLQSSTSLQQETRRRERRPVDPQARRDRPAAPAKPIRPLSPGAKAVAYVTRMVVLSVGIGVLAGTLLSIWDPATRASTSTQTAAKPSPSPAPTIAPSPQLAVGQELTPLKAAVQALIVQAVAQSPQTSPSAFFLDLDTNAYVDVNGSASVPAASTIKVPILVAFFQDVDAGKVRLDEVLTMRKELIGTGSGDMQWQAPGTQFTALDTIKNMIIVSDNTATNMVIARLGGIAVLNQRFKSWGLSTTAMNNMLPDLEGTNLTSAKDMTFLMTRVSQGELLSARSRDRMLGIMQKTVNDSLLPRGLGEGATIAHKTGDIGTLVGDVGLVDMPNGKRYAAAVLSKRAFNDDRATELIRQISRTVYQSLSRPVAPKAAPRADSEAPRNPDGSVVNPASTAMTPLDLRAEQ
ncbi:MAG TPA: serine hydrolase [Thermosynechococcaceae cyanobacterium]